jgi:hypothetical protein
MAIHSTGAIENRGRDIKSMVVRAANVTQVALPIKGIPSY